jgi:hypothetical protein
MGASINNIAMQEKLVPKAKAVIVPLELRMAWWDLSKEMVHGWLTIVVPRDIDNVQMRVQTKKIPNPTLSRFPRGIQVRKGAPSEIKNVSTKDQPSSAL